MWEKKLNEYKKRLKACFQKMFPAVLPAYRRRDYHQFTALKPAYFYNNLWAAPAEGEQFILLRPAKDGPVNARPASICSSVKALSCAITIIIRKAKGFSDFVLRSLATKSSRRCRAILKTTATGTVYAFRWSWLSPACLSCFFSQETVYSKPSAILAHLPLVYNHHKTVLHFR